MHRHVQFQYDVMRSRFEQLHRKFCAGSETKTLSLKVAHLCSDLNANCIQTIIIISHNKSISLLTHFSTTALLVVWLKLVLPLVWLSVSGHGPLLSSNLPTLPGLTVFLDLSGTYLVLFLFFDEKDAIVEFRFARTLLAYYGLSQRHRGYCWHSPCWRTWIIPSYWMIVRVYFWDESSPLFSL